jgi:hypothetical protein
VARADAGSAAEARGHLERALAWYRDGAGADERNAARVAAVLARLNGTPGDQGS